MSYDKETRKERRRRDLVAKSLEDNLYRQRVVPPKKEETDNEQWKDEVDDWYFSQDRVHLDSIHGVGVRTGGSLLRPADKDEV